MTKKELKEKLIMHNEDPEELKGLSKEELEDVLNEYENHFDLFPNDDEFDGSHDYD